MLPSGAWGKRAVWIVSVTIPRRVSITDTQLLDAQATKIRSSLGMHGDLVGVLADGDPGDGVQVVRVEDAHRPAGPVGDKQLSAVARHDDVIGPRAGWRGLQLLEGLEIERRDRSAVDVERVEHLALGSSASAAAKMARLSRWLAALVAGSGRRCGSGGDPPAGTRAARFRLRPTTRSRSPSGASARPNQLCRTAW